jgi:hypothetical protein
MSDGTNSEPPKSEESKGFMEKMGAALPIGLTALATVFAGMSTGALQQAMYWKSQAAQDQSKATNQWTLAGFKVDRSLVMQTAAAQLWFSAGGKKAEFAPNPNDAAEKAAAEWLAGKGPPAAHRRGASSKDREGRVGLPDITQEPLKELLEMIRKRAPEDDLLRKASHIKIDDINKVIDEAEAANETITEGEWGPIIAAARKLAADARKNADPAKSAAIQAAQFEMEQRRYRTEATLNQEIGIVYEARVKISSAESDKHRKKSQTLFIAMLVAQIGGVISSLALARKKKSALWLFAGAAGLVAIGFGGYVLIDF